MFISTCFVQSEEMQKKLLCAQDTDVQDASCSSCLQFAQTKENVKNWKSFHHRQPSPTVAQLTYSITLRSCSSPCSSRGILLCGLLHVVTWQGPQAEVHGSPFIRQEQRSVLQKPSLRNTVNGVVAYELVNVHQYEEVARAIMHNTNGKLAFTLTFRRRDKPITLGETSAVRIAAIEPLIPVFYSNVSYYLPRLGSCHCIGSYELQTMSFPSCPLRFNVFRK